MTNTDTSARDGAALREVMDRSMLGVTAPTGRIEAAAVSSGRRLRRRRTLGSALGAAAVLAVAALVLPQVLDAPRGSGQVATDPSPTFPSDSSGDRSPTAAQPAAGWWDMPAPEMLRRLNTILPGDTTVMSAKTHHEGTPMVGLLIADLTSSSSQGPGGLYLSLYPPEAPGEGGTDAWKATDEDGNEVTDIRPIGPSLKQQISCPGNLINAHECTELVDADGHYGRISSTVTNEVVQLEAIIVTGEDAVVHLATANTVDDKWDGGSTVSAAEPPLDLEEMRAIVEDPTWQDWTPPADED